MPNYMSKLDIFRKYFFQGQYIVDCVYNIMGSLEPNSLNPKKSDDDLKLGDIFLTVNGYMKVSCLRPLTLISLVSWRQS